MTYLLLSLPFLAVGLIVFLIGAEQARRHGELPRHIAAWAVTTITLLILTTVFDNIMLAAGFFDYSEDGISGIRLVRMPIEDLLYPIAGALLLSGVWQLLGGTRDPEGDADD